MTWRWPEVVVGVEAHQVRTKHALKQRRTLRLTRCVPLTCTMRMTPGQVPAPNMCSTMQMQRSQDLPPAGRIAKNGQDVATPYAPQERDGAKTCHRRAMRSSPPARAAAPLPNRYNPSLGLGRAAARRRPTCPKGLASSRLARVHRKLPPTTLHLRMRRALHPLALARGMRPLAACCVALQHNVPCTLDRMSCAAFGPYSATFTFHDSGGDVCIMCLAWSHLRPGVLSWGSFGGE